MSYGSSLPRPALIRRRPDCRLLLKNHRPCQHRRRRRRRNRRFHPLHRHRNILPKEVRSAAAIRRSLTAEMSIFNRFFRLFRDGRAAHPDAVEVLGMATAFPACLFSRAGGGGNRQEKWPCCVCETQQGRKKIPGAVLLSHSQMYSTIAAGVLNHRVREGNGCFNSAMSTGKKITKKENVFRFIRQG